MHRKYVSLRNAVIALAGRSVRIGAESEWCADQGQADRRRLQTAIEEAMEHSFCTLKEEEEKEKGGKGKGNGERH